MRPNLFFIILFSFVFTLWGCSYTLRSTEGPKISAAQIQEIRLGRTTEADLLKFLGPPSKRERKPDGTLHLLYIRSELKSPTLPWGIVLYGLFDREEKDVFEIILIDGIVQSFRFLKK